MTGQGNVVILGAGITGLALGVSSGYPVFEAKENAGGIPRACDSGGM